jgi:hypothetical protein
MPERATQADEVAGDGTLLLCHECDDEAESTAQDDELALASSLAGPSDLAQCGIPGTDGCLHGMQ